MNEVEELKILLARAEMMLTESKEVLREAQMSEHEELLAQLNEQLKRARMMRQIAEILFWFMIGALVAFLIGWIA